MKPAQGSLVLVPVGLGDAPWTRFLPDDAQRAVTAIRHFVVETPKAARAQLKALAHPMPLRDIDIKALPGEGPGHELDALLAPTLEGRDVGLMSDAGCPGVADPGARLVARAHALGIRVRPLVGPSSILLALMASGLNGQSFAFCGYLPVAEGERDRRLRHLEEESRRLERTQIFIETPYRNGRMFEALLKVCDESTRVCVACELTTDSEWILTQTVGAWRTRPRPDLERRPALFLLLAG